MIKYYFTGCLILFLHIDSSLAQVRKDSAMSVIGDTFNQSMAEFRDTLGKTLIEFDTSMTYWGKENASDHFCGIIKIWPDQWIAYYYMAYSLTILSIKENNEIKRDSLLDEADNYIDSASRYGRADNDELYVLAALTANFRLAIDPMSRWKKYGEIFNKDIKKATELQPGNPRIYYLKGNYLLHMPKMLGGGAQMALPYFEKADSLYQMEINVDILKPSWGRKLNSLLLDSCKANKRQ